MCVQSLEPPNQQLKECRQILQGLAIGFLFLSLLSSLAGESQLLLAILVILMLYFCWAQFNWVICCLMFFFQVYGLIILVIQVIYIIEMMATKSDELLPEVSQSSKTQGKQLQISRLLILCQILKLIYQPIAVYYVHYCYKHFKNYAMDTGAGISFSIDSLRQQENMGSYQRMQGSQQASGKNHRFFQGQGVAIG